MIVVYVYCIYNQLIPDKYIISVERVRSLLSKIDINKSIGPDHLPNWLLKDFQDVLSAPVCSLFNSSIAQACVPTIWKSADIVPLPKVRPPSAVEKDLRPVALTPVLAKLLEGIMCEWHKELRPLEILGEKTYSAFTEK